MAAVAQSRSSIGHWLVVTAMATSIVAFSSRAFVPKKRLDGRYRHLAFVAMDPDGGACVTALGEQARGRAEARWFVARARASRCR